MTLAIPFAPLTIRGRSLLPVVQGGMGVGISAHRLAGSVAREGALGTIASIDLRHHHADLLARCRARPDRDTLEAANLEALRREIERARSWSEGRGMIAVNVMKAVRSHADYVRLACDAGADAIVMGAGLPLDLPELTEGHDIALIPILSDARGIALVLKKWMKKGRLPDAIVIEHPAHAGGHLGVSRIEEANDARFDFARVLGETRQTIEALGLAREAIPLIVGGGINSHQAVREALGLGASGVQVGTPFAVTEEGDAHPAFKQVLVQARPEDIVDFISVTGLPARAVRTPWLERYLRHETRIRSKLGALRQRCPTALECLSVCGLRDGIERFGHFCIDTRLAAALRGDVANGLFFRGRETLPFGNAIRSVRDLLALLLTGTAPEPATNRPTFSLA
ncbi:NAD(P)H-dependent flavin oxidoreductase [Burkholderia gladioli]|uniref:2-nitropropane dioxygenase n=1 Tax=Burkholderia gladioli TaxID=28095 RepID=A0A2A7S4R9_BURGA|nr:nitronate monooxygenase family protein [Burkholderia gladioli]MBU9197057.1 nitronate monooxygenase family protein [Burkholderia gladioli]MBU9214585.1 nitronate monooxygenase family protein [Burkholderia gladioli]MBU9422820.1 nitronate monooxygenase family protein [Burkholderia gladioli]MDN7722845.1 nitronate monooxygenase family protein [Burkholderia gladioli]MDN7921448.1 nitronate monooxygenase family protein [Burkholderia gladioli]